jgi:hypothetical protein
MLAKDRKRSEIKYYPLCEISQKARKQAQQWGEVCKEGQVDRLRVLLVQRSDNCFYNGDRLQGREAETEKPIAGESDS